VVQHRNHNRQMWKDFRWSVRRTHRVFESWPFCIYQRKQMKWFSINNQLRVIWLLWVLGWQYSLYSLTNQYSSWKIFLFNFPNFPCVFSSKWLLESHGFLATTLRRADFCDFYQFLYLRKNTMLHSWGNM
jgi:hypothetical protein